MKKLIIDKSFNKISLIYPDDTIINFFNINNSDIEEFCNRVQYAVEQNWQIKFEE